MLEILSAPNLLQVNNASMHRCTLVSWTDA